MGPKFGTSGLRGLATELVGSVSALHATAFARMLLDEGYVSPGSAILIGRDFRPSSPDIAAICMGALKRVGLTPLDCGELPTPALALYGLKIGAASLMVTGSHIPADRNGIKFYRPDGEITKADEQAITKLAEQLSLNAAATAIEYGSGVDHSIEAARLFRDRCQVLLPADGLRGLKVGVYQHSSVARDMLVTILENCGATVVSLGRSEIFIPVDTEAVSDETREKLAAWAKEYELDAIVSTDGDADRPLVADEDGIPLRGDLLGLISASFLKASIIATPVTSNSGIEGASGAEVIRTRVGSPYVIAAMNEALERGERAVIGFEANGGVMVASNFPVATGTLEALPTRDCILPILTALHAAAEAKAPLSVVAGQHALQIALSDRIQNYAIEKSGLLMTYLRASDENLSQFLGPIGRVKAKSDVDGLRVTFEDGRILHIRPSGNAPELRCYVEAGNQSEAEKLMAQGLALLDSWDGGLSQSQP
ncbi:phosphomannomutase [Sinorhizobium meliloti]|jgi:phosphomannomutase|uniref:phosphomannomutase n=1 Tax=Rhizobium meliloti TaxID=382 RepID=UPI0020C0D63F|nr:phosphomannomutase [Sinorhizobium meliloti]